jgi:hypothetical protein
MDSHDIPNGEVGAFRAKQELNRIVGRILDAQTGDPAVKQFEADFALLAQSVIDPARHGQPIPHNLPRGPLKRMAKLIGFGPLRFLLNVGSDRFRTDYRIVLRPRLDKEYPRGNHFKKHRDQSDLIWFGNTVLGLKRESVLIKDKALESAALQLGQSASLRTLQRRYQAFRLHCQELGYVPSPSEWNGRPPQFSLADL